MPDIESLPEGVDLALISLPANQIPAAIMRCGAKGVRAATILSGGFAELGSDEGRRVEQELRRAIQTSGVRVCGPNCQGGINLFDRVAATYSGALTSGNVAAGPIALITQSGVFGGLVFAAAQEEGIGVGLWSSTGNEVDLRFCDFLDYAAADPRVRVIGGYLESVKDSGARFVQSLQRARRAGKPVVVLKTGRTEAGRTAAASHTAALAGSDEGYAAALHRGGAVRVDSADAFRDLVAAFSSGRVPRGGRVGVVSISGGAATLIADECGGRALEIPAFSEGLRRTLEQVVPTFGSVVNPVDLTGQLVSDAGLLEKAAIPILDSGEIDVLVIFIGMCDANKDALVDVIGRLGQHSTLPIVVTWVAAADKSVYPRIRQHGVPVFRDPTACMSTVASMLQWAQATLPSPQSSPATIDRVLLDELHRLPDGVLTEARAKTLLARAGLPVPAGRMVRSAAEAEDAVAEVGGDAVMKLQAPSVPHKSDIGGVRVGVSVERAKSEFTALQAILPPDAEGVLVESRITNAVECFIGIQRHPIFGPMVAVGLGGVFIEVFHDVAIRLAPVQTSEALAMIQQLKGYAILKGARGQPPRDIDALADLVRRVSELAAGAGDCIQEMDLNPVFVRAQHQGVVIGDALMVINHSDS